MEKTVSQRLEQLDEEWVELIQSALETGISPDSIRSFLKIRQFDNQDDEVFVPAE